MELCQYLNEENYSSKIFTAETEQELIQQIEEWKQENCVEETEIRFQYKPNVKKYIVTGLAINDLHVMNLQEVNKHELHSYPFVTINDNKLVFEELATEEDKEIIREYFNTTLYDIKSFIDGDFAVNCCNDYQAKKLLKVLKFHKLKWVDGDDLSFSTFQKYGYKTCYFYDDGLRFGEDEEIEKSYKVIPFTDLKFKNGIIKINKEIKEILNKEKLNIEEILLLEKNEDIGRIDYKSTFSREILDIEGNKYIKEIFYR